MSHVLLAVDLGASSGRVLAGLFDGGRVRLEEVHRFPNGPFTLAGSMHWDVLALWSEIRAGLRAAAARYQGSAHGAASIKSVGVDTWGVDFALLGRGDVLLSNPHHYRDHRTDGLMEQAFEVVPRAEIFAATGLQFMQFNTLYQLWALRRQSSPLLEAAESFLMIPDFFHWLLTGQKSNEFTNASTTQFFDPRCRAWATDLLSKFDIPSRILGSLIEPGTNLGPLRADIAAETGLGGVSVIAPGTHDTASAVLAVPAETAGAGPPDWCYISSGTWSLLGAETPRPVINDTCRRLNFTNEGGVGGTTRLLKNITGLWLLQECRRIWAQSGKTYSWDEIARMTDAAPPHASLINPDDPVFSAPSDMPAAIREFCRRTNQPVPQAESEVLRCALDSLALKCRQVLGWLEQLTGSRMKTIHIVGGGAMNRQLCQATADACGRPVLAGPVEATALGNLMMQAVALGLVSSIAEARQVIRASFDVETYEPRDTARWDEVFGRFVGYSPEPTLT